MLSRALFPLGVSTVALATQLACLPGAPVANAVSGAMWGDADQWTGYDSVAPFTIQGGALRGDVGNIDGIDGSRGRVNGWGEEGILSLDVTVAREGGGAGMAILTLVGSLSDLATAPSGVYVMNNSGEPLIIDENGDSYVTIDGDEEINAGDDTTRGDVVLCSGPTTDEWEYDQPADDVVLEVEDPVEYNADPEACPECTPIETRRVTFHSRTRFYDEVANEDRVQEATGAFTIVAQ